MTTTRHQRHARLLTLAFAFASTCVSFASTLELLNLQSGNRLDAVLQISPQTSDL